MTQIQSLCDLLTGTDVVGDSDSLAPLRRYHAAKNAINGNRCCVIERRLSAMRAALKPFCVTVTANGSKIRVFNPLRQVEMTFD